MLLVLFRMPLNSTEQLILYLSLKTGKLWVISISISKKKAERKILPALKKVNFY